MSEQPEISVCLCTHQPRAEYLARTLEGLRRQTLAGEAWDLVVVDNASVPPLEGRIDLSGLPETRVVREGRLGLTRARLAAIAAARGAILVFVDDDNVLADDYLEQVRRIFAERADLGAIGGRRSGEYAARPAAWARYFLNYLAVGEFGDQPRWTKERDLYVQWFPAGAGMAIRRTAAERYARRIESDEERIGLDRVGVQLSGCGDVDMLLTVTDAGEGIGYFPELLLAHLIPAERVQFEYLRRLVFASMFSLTRLRMARDAGHRLYPWPLEYLRSWLMCARAGQWRPRTWALAAQIARGRYAAMRGKKG